MSTLRDTIETVFVAAAFAECNLDQEARAVLGKVGQVRPQGDAAQPDAKSRRQRPSLKA